MFDDFDTQIQIEELTPENWSYYYKGEDLMEKDFKDCFTIEELINELQKYPKNAVVWFFNDDDRSFIDHGIVCVLDDGNIGISSRPFSYERFWKE